MLGSFGLGWLRTLQETSARFLHWIRKQLPTRDLTVIGLNTFVPPASCASNRDWLQAMTKEWTTRSVARLITDIYSDSSGIQQQNAWHLYKRIKSDDRFSEQERADILSELISTLRR